MKKIVAIVLIVITALLCLASCDNPKENALVDAEYAWTQIADKEALKIIAGYDNGWFFDSEAGVYKYNTDRYTVTTADGTTFEVGEYDGSSANRFDTKEEGNGDSVVFPKN